MTQAPIGLADLVGMFMGFVLTLAVFSYILGDNPLFRVASYLFVGVSAGFVAVAALTNVILPQLVTPLLRGDLLVLAPLALCVLLALRLIPRLAGLSSPVMAYLVGVGAATAIGGAVLGTIFPQISGAASAFDMNVALSANTDPLMGLVNGVLMLAGMVLTLGYFQFGQRGKSGPAAPRPLWMQVFYWGGGVFIAITFGVLFANVYATAMAALVERLGSLVDFILSLI